MPRPFRSLPVFFGLAVAALAAADRPAAPPARHPERLCYFIRPIANKDGVARGRTRFNLRGVDLNRGRNQPASADLRPENHALHAELHAILTP